MNSLDSTNLASILQKISHYMNTKTIKSRDKVIKVHNNEILGSGCNGLVCCGTLADRKEKKKTIDVAIKRIALKYSSSNKREEQALRKLNHPNVIRLFYTTSHNNFRYNIRIVEKFIYYIKDLAIGLSLRRSAWFNSFR